MKDIIEWLARIDEGAHHGYEKAAEVFKADRDLYYLLRGLSADEKMHFDVLNAAQEYFKDKEYPSVFTFDEESKRKIERPFNELARKLDGGELSKNELLNLVIVIEFSELNNIFLYVLNALKEHSKKHFASVAANIEHHKDGIERYVQGHPELAIYLKRLKHLPKVRSERILVVDDKGANVNLLKAVLEAEGAVESASNGDEALKKVSANYFSAIVTDLEMPVMDGIEFFMKATERQPEIKGRFVFFTASIDPVKISFLRKNNIRFLTKPSPISDIRKTVKEVLSAKRC